MPRMQGLNFLPDSFISFDLKIYLILMILLQFLDFFLVPCLLAFELISQLVMFLQRILNIGVFDLFISLKSQFVFLFKSLNLLSIDNVQLFLFQLQLLFRTQNLEF